MTIDYLKVNLEGCFARGQAYVACSRGRSAETMTVDGWREDRVMTSDIVKEFYSSIQNKTNFKPPTWAIVLEDAKREDQIKELLKIRYCDNKTCQKCPSGLIVRKVKSGPNKDKWLLQCVAQFNLFREQGHAACEWGHTFDYVATPSIG